MANCYSSIPTDRYSCTCTVMLVTNDVYSNFTLWNGLLLVEHGSFVSLLDQNKKLECTNRWHRGSIKNRIQNWIGLIMIRIDIIQLDTHWVDLVYNRMYAADTIFPRTYILYQTTGTYIIPSLAYYNNDNISQNCILIDFVCGMLASHRFREICVISIV